MELRQFEKYGEIPKQSNTAFFRKPKNCLLSIFPTLENCTLSVLHCSQHSLYVIKKRKLLTSSSSGEAVDNFASVP